MGSRRANSRNNFSDSPEAPDSCAAAMLASTRMEVSRAADCVSSLTTLRAPWIAYTLPVARTKTNRTISSRLSRTRRLMALLTRRGANALGMLCYTLSPTFNAGLAQPVERPPCKRIVGSSNLSSGTSPRLSAAGPNGAGASGAATEKTGTRRSTATPRDWPGP